MLTQLKECFEEWLQIHDLDYDYSFYTPAEWKDRGEEFLCDSELVFVADNQLIQHLSYGDNSWSVEDELQDLVEGFGFYFEFGNHWNFAFYRREGLLPLPPSHAPYKELLTDPRWIKKRKRIAERSKGVCENCGVASKLEVHHCYYRYGRFPWQYPDASLLHLCRACHEARRKAELNFRGFLPILKTEEIFILRQALKDGLYWFPRKPLWEFISEIGYDIEKCDAKLQLLKPLRSHEEDRKA